MPLRGGERWGGQVWERARGRVAWAAPPWKPQQLLGPQSSGEAALVGFTRLRPAFQAASLPWPFSVLLLSPCSPSRFQLCPHLISPGVLPVGVLKPFLRCFLAGLACNPLSAPVSGLRVLSGGHVIALGQPCKTQGPGFLLS